MASYNDFENDPLEEEKNCRLTYFFRDLLRKRIDLRIDDDETEDIKCAVDSLVEMIVAIVISSVPILSSFSRVVKVGSMAEGTKIKHPDEFDYIVVSDQDDVKVKRVCSWRKGYAHIKVTSSKLQSEWEPFLCGEYLRGSFSYDFFSRAPSEIAQYLWSVSKKWLRENHLVEKSPKSIWSPYFDSLENAFMVEVQRVLKNSEEVLVHKTDTGTLRVNKYVENHGPAFMPRFIWIPRNRKEKIHVTVDITLAIGVKFSPGDPIITERDTFHPKVWEALQKHGRYLLIPCHESSMCHAGLCFRLTFTEPEVDLVQNMSEHHKECYKLLKYIFNGGRGVSYIPSYALKTLIIKHDCVCKETANLAKCFKSVIALLLHHIMDRNIEERFELSRLIRLFIPGRKFKMNIPSIFIGEHNILDCKNYILPCEQFQMAMEKMLKSLEMISSEDNPDATMLKLVNSLKTAARAYGLSLLPVRTQHWQFRSCMSCVENYFYG